VEVAGIEPVQRGSDLLGRSGDLRKRWDRCGVGWTCWPVLLTPSTGRDAANPGWPDLTRLGQAEWMTGAQASPNCQSARRTWVVPGADSSREADSGRGLEARAEAGLAALRQRRATLSKLRA